MSMLSRKIRNIRGEHVIRAIEEWYRFIISITLLGYLGFRGLAYKGLPFAFIIFGYCIYSLIVYILKGRIAYSIDRYRLIRTVFDIIFPLILIIFTRGAESPAFALLVLPIFFASYRYSTGTANLVTLTIVFSYIIICLLVSWQRGEAFVTQTMAKVGVLVFVWFSNRYSRLFLMERMKRASISDIKSAEVDLHTIAEKVCNALYAQACLIFTKEGDKYQLATYTKRGQIEQKKDDFPKDERPNISLSKEFTGGIEGKRANFHILSSQDKNGVFDKTVEEIAEEISLRKPGIESIVGRFFVYPCDETKNVILVINKLRRRFFLKSVYNIQDFRKEDFYLLEFVIDRILSGIVLQLQKIDANTFSAMVDEGVAEEICTFNKAYETTSINKVKREFFRLDKSALGKKCYWLYHRRNKPCEDCESKNAFENDKIVSWEKRYNHPITGRTQIAHIKAKRILNRKGEYEVMETVHDVTEKHKSDAITKFVLDLQEDKPPVDEQKLATRATKLFREIGFERARFYEYEPAKDRFACLGSHGMKENLGYRKFFVSRKQDKVSEWMDDDVALPVLIRLEKTKHDPTYAKVMNGYQIYYVDTFPFKERLKKEKVTEQLDLPIVFGGRMLGKISVDNYSEESDEEIFRFNKDDLLIAHVSSRIIGHVWESARKEQLDDYIEALEHEILEPLHIIAGHADFVRKYFDKSGVSQERKKLKLVDIIQELELLNAVIRGPRIETIRKEDYEMEDVDFFKDVVIKAITHIRDYYAIRKNVDIKHLESCHVPKMWIDKNKFDLVFYNLLINAVKYADNNSIVWVKTSKEDEFYKIDIENQGLAITEVQEEKIFLKYYRAVEGMDKDPGGKGLGLYIARLIVENHDGQLYVSKRENPTTFTLKIPKTSYYGGEYNG